MTTYPQTTERQVMEQQNARLSDLNRTLCNVVAAGSTVAIALRVDGGTDDANLLISSAAASNMLLKVCVQGFKERADTWSLVEAIRTAVCGLGVPFPSHIQSEYERVINGEQSGWVVLTVTDGKAVKAQHRSHAA